MTPDAIIAIDLGGTRFRTALVTLDGQIIKRQSGETRSEEGRERLLERVAESVEYTIGRLQPEQLLGLGAAVPGPVDPWSGLVKTPPNLRCLSDVNVKERWEMEFGLPVWVGNDANLGALGEFRFGVGRGASSLVYITVSTGIGGGVILNGELYLGWQGLAGEIGHMIIAPGGPECSCGNRGCLEAIASGTGIANKARQRLAAGQASELSELPVEQISAEHVSEAARRGDPLALAVMAEAAEALSIGVQNLVHLINPQRVVIGGGVVNGYGELLESVRRYIALHAMEGFRVEIEPASLGDDTCLLGAVALVLQEAGSG